MVRARIVFIIASIVVLMFSIGIPQNAVAEQVGVSARNAILIEQESGRVIFEKNAHDKQRIASITKVMTAILAIEHGNLDKEVTVGNNASGVEGSSIWLSAGEKMKLPLQGVLIPYVQLRQSGNELLQEVAGFPAQMLVIENPVPEQRAFVNMSAHAGM